MNRYMLEKWPWIEGTHGMRSQLLDSLSDADLAFSPGGQNMTLGALCREMGEVEYSYIQSLKTFRQDWSLWEWVFPGIGIPRNWGFLAFAIER